ncbi:MAG: energy transducer TonB [Candidatus Korobacteraceae bacterium]|jgi:protein TonB
MFEDSLVESGRRLAGRNPWTTVISFGAQSLLGGVLVLLSLVYTEALPSQKLTSMLEAPAPPPATAPAPRSVTRAAKQTSELDRGALMLPREIPKAIVLVRDDELPGSSVLVPGTGVPNSVPGSVPNTMISELLRNIPVAVPKATVQKVRVSSGVAQGLLIHQVKPQYPALARQARIQGTVALQAVIGKDGAVQNLRVLSGHPMLTEAAIDAVKQWLYRPYYLNGEPVEVDTQINVNFTLSE